MEERPENSKLEQKAAELYRPHPGHINKNMLRTVLHHLVKRREAAKTIEALQSGAITVEEALEDLMA
jgi:hypothetical protein